MRVTFVSACADLSGGSRAVAVHAQRLMQRGHQVTVVSRPPQPPTFKDRVKAVLRGRTLPRPSGANHFQGTGLSFKLVSPHRPVSPSDVPDADVVIATWWETAEWVNAYPARKGVKVHFIQDYEVWGHGSVERVDATCRLPMAKITPAKWVKELLASKFGMTNVSLVPNAVDLSLFTAPPRGKQPVPTVGFTYTTFLNKGCDVILKAVEQARRNVPNLKLVTFGSSPVMPELPLPEGTEHHERAPESALKDFYAKCDAWLFGTRREGFGLPILEAMACRTPLIATPAGAVPELVGQGGGMLVPHEDPAAMAKAIEDVVAMDETQWRMMSDKAYATASQFTWDDAADLFEQALLEATGERQSAGAAPVGTNSTAA